MEMLLIQALLSSLVHLLLNDTNVYNARQPLFDKILRIYGILPSRLPFTQNGDIRNTNIRLLPEINFGQWGTTFI